MSGEDKIKKRNNSELITQNENFSNLNNLSIDNILQQFNFSNNPIKKQKQPVHPLNTQISQFKIQKIRIMTNESEDILNTKEFYLILPIKNNALCLEIVKNLNPNEFPNFIICLSLSACIKKLHSKLNLKENEDIHILKANLFPVNSDDDFINYLGKTYYAKIVPLIKTNNFDFNEHLKSTLITKPNLPLINLIHDPDKKSFIRTKNLIYKPDRIKISFSSREKLFSHRRSLQISENYINLNHSTLLEEIKIRPNPNFHNFKRFSQMNNSEDLIQSDNKNINSSFLKQEGGRNENINKSGSAIKKLNSNEKISQFISNNFRLARHSKCPSFSLSLIDTEVSLKLNNLKKIKNDFQDINDNISNFKNNVNYSDQKSTSANSSLIESRRKSLQKVFSTPDIKSKKNDISNFDISQNFKTFQNYEICKEMYNQNTKLYESVTTSFNLLKNTIYDNITQVEEKINSLQFFDLWTLTFGQHKIKNMLKYQKEYLLIYYISCKYEEHSDKLPSFNDSLFLPGYKKDNNILSSFELNKNLQIVKTILDDLTLDNLLLSKFIRHLAKTKTIKNELFDLPTLNKFVYIILILLPRNLFSKHKLYIDIIISALSITDTISLDNYLQYLLYFKFPHLIPFSKKFLFCKRMINVASMTPTFEINDLLNFQKILNIDMATYNLLKNEGLSEICNITLDKNKKINSVFSAILNYIDGI